MKRSPISYQEFRDRVSGWLVHHTMIPIDKWRVRTRKFQALYGLDMDPDKVAILIMGEPEDLVMPPEVL